MGKITQSSDIKELFSKLIVTKNKLNLIKTYYSDLGDSLTTDLNDLATKLSDEVTWMENQLKEMEALQSEAITASNQFTSLTGQDTIVNHAKYLEMLALYNKYISAFYKRMTELESVYEESFLKSEINSINSSWKFHYSEDRTDGSNITHSFASINFTNTSDIIEISNNRFIFRSDENCIYDANYNTKNCYVTGFDGKTIFNKLLNQGSLKGYLGEESAKIIKLFKLPGNSSIYVLVDLRIVDSVEDGIDVIGNASDGAIHEIYICKYDIDEKTLTPLFEETGSNTSILRIRDNVLNNNDITFLTEKYNDFYYFYISSYFVRIKVEGSNGNDASTIIAMKSNVDICSAVIIAGKYLVIPVASSKVALFDLSNAYHQTTIDQNEPVREYNFATNANLSIGESGIIKNIINTNKTLFILTEKSVWKTVNTGNAFVNIEKDNRMDNVSTSANIDFSDKSSYIFNDDGILYCLANNNYIYRVESADVWVKSPTRYSDRLFFMKSDAADLSAVGYPYNRNTDKLGGETVIHTFVYGNKSCFISASGKVARCVSNSGFWLAEKTPIIQSGESITAIYENGDTEILIATSGNKVYKTDKSVLSADGNTLATLLLDTTGIGSVYAMCVDNNILYLGGYAGRVSAYDIKKDVFVEFNSETTDYVVSDGAAMGSQNIRAMFTANSQLIVMGNSGKVASCSLVSKLWTKYDGSAVNGTTTDAIIYNNGSAVANKDITCFINYTNTTLFIFTVGGKIASCNLLNGAWTNNDGVSSQLTLEGPGIANDGSFVNNETIRSVTRINEALIVTTDNSYIASINPVTGGTTSYKGVNVYSDINGPDISFDGSSFDNKSIQSITVDNENGILVFAGESAYISSYSIEDKAVLNPNVAKLYYVGRQSTDNDFMSSYLIQLSVSTVKEYKALTPPRDVDSLYISEFDGSHYIYRRGDTVYRISTNSFNEVGYSTDGGISFTKINTLNQNWYSIVSSSVNEDENVASKKNYVFDEPIGYVTSSGELGFYVAVNNIPHFLFTKSTNGVVSASWYSPSTFTGQNEIKKFGLIDNGKNHLFYINAENSKNKTVPYIVKRSSSNPSNVDLEPMFTPSDIISLDKINDNCYIAMNSESSVVISTEYSLFLAEYTMDEFGLNPRISTTVERKQLFKDDSSFVSKFFNRYFDNKSDAGYLTVNKGLCLGFFTTDKNHYNFAFGNALTGDINVVTVSIYDKTSVLDITVDSTLTKRSIWDTVDNVIYAKQYIPIFGKTRYTTDTDVSISDIDFEKKYLETFDNGKDGLLGFNVGYTQHYSTEVANNGGYRKNHVVVSLKCDNFGQYLAQSYRVYKMFDNFGHMISVDHENKDAMICLYNGVNNAGRIRHVNSIRTLVCENTATNTPMRSLADSWYTARIGLANDNNGIAIKCKLRVLGTDKDVDSVSRQDAIRYQVLISSKNSGKFILYEVEKSPIMSRFDRETKAPNPLFKVKAIDRFDGTISELFTSRISGRQNVFQRVQPTESYYPINFNSKSATTFDFMGYIDLSSLISSSEVGIQDVVDIAIKPINTLPSTVDVQFFAESYYIPKKTTSPVYEAFNNIKRSEYNDINSLHDINDIQIGIPGMKGFLEKSAPDIIGITDRVITTNNANLPQVDAQALNKEVGNADTYCVRLTGTGDGTYREVSGIIVYTNMDGWKFTPYNVNRKRVDYEFDEAGSKSITTRFVNTKLYKAGRNISKMHNFGVYGKSVINNADFYTNYENNKARLVKSDGLYASLYGLYESVSSFDGYQRRIKPILESGDNGLYRKIDNAYDIINPRSYGLSFDITDRYSIFELPYYYNQSWWIPAKGYITRGNESLLTFDADESETHYKFIGRYRLPFDNITAPNISVGNKTGDEGGGIGDGGNVFDSNVVTYSRLIAEKYPLEHWDGFNDLDFVREWEDTYADRTVKSRWVVEKPKNENGTTKFITYNTRPKVETASNPTIPRNLYYYDDNYDWELRGTQLRKYMTGYYYDSHNWKIYFQEQVTVVRDYPDTYKTYNINANRQLYLDDHHLSEVKSTSKTEAWYVPTDTTSYLGEAFKYNTAVWGTINKAGKPTDSGVATWPRAKTSIVGQAITKIVTPVVDLVAIMDSAGAYEQPSPERSITSLASKLTVFRKGVLQYNFTNNTGANTYNPSYSLFKLAGNLLAIEPTAAEQTDYTLATLKTAIASLAAGTIISIVTKNVLTIDSTLASYMGSFGLPTTQYTNAARSAIYAGVKGKTGQIGIVGYVNNQKSVNNYVNYGYDNNVGMIQPYKFDHGQWKLYTGASDTTWNASGAENTNFIISRRTYYANCSENDEDFNPTITTNTPKIYDRYCGGDQRCWLYADKKTVSFTKTTTSPTTSSLSTKTYSKVYYKYYTSGETHESTVKTIPTFWDVRAPSNNPSTAVVDTKIISVSVPTNTKLTRTYTYKRWYNNGTTGTETVTYNPRYKWIFIPSDAVYTVAGTDVNGKDYYEIPVTEYYEWADGYIHDIPNKVYTFGNLSTKWGVSSTLNIDIGLNSENEYIKTYTVKFTGPELTSISWNSSGAGESRTITKVLNIVYSPDQTAVANSSKDTNATRYVKWQGGTGLN